MHAQTPDERGRSGRITWRAAIPLGVLVAGIVAALVVSWKLGYFELDQRDRLAAGVRRVEQLPWSGALFVLSYSTAVICGLPIAVLNIFGGALFGTTPGAGLAWAGAMIGTAAAHTLARSIARGAIGRVLGRHRLFHKLRAGADVRTLMRLRILPVAPFGILDYAAGMVGVPLSRLLMATAPAIVPGTIAYTYAGDRFRAALEDPAIVGGGELFAAGLVTILMTLTALFPWLRSLRSGDTRA